MILHEPTHPRRPFAYTFVTTALAFVVGVGSGAAAQAPAAPSPGRSAAESSPRGPRAGEQQPARQDRPQFEAAVDMVLIDCVVLDEDGDFLPGLTQADFLLYEEGEPVDISFFSVQRFGTPRVEPAAVPAATEEVPAGELAADLSSAATLPRYVVLFIDGFNTSPAEWAEVKGAVVQYVREILRPGDRILVANLTPARQLRVAPEFTSEPGLLEAVLSAVQTNPEIRLNVVRNETRLIEALQIEDDPGGGTDAGVTEVEATALRMGASLAGFYAQERREQVLFTLDTLTGLAEHLDRSFAIPGPKTLLMVSGGISSQPGARYYYILDAYEQQATLEMRSQGGIGGHDPISHRSGGETVDEYMRSAIGKLNRLNYSVYAIDARGAGDFFSDSPEYQVRTGLAPELRQQIFEAAQEGLVDIARGTGGLSFTGTSNFLGALEAIHADTAYRYVLGYVPPEHHPKDLENDKFYRVRVEVDVPGVRVRAREGYVDR
jgi:VWFA-related protein